MRKKLLFLVLPFILLLLNSTIATAQADKIEGIWYNAEKTGKIQVYKAKENKFYGKIIWLQEPNRNGKPKLDENNSDESKRTQPEMGLMVLKGFKKDGDDLYDDGTVYDPKNGKTYACKITYKTDHLDIRGYVGISLIGRTTVWTKAD
jgi:uncharacterized protein (DUF2147 family)